MTSLHAAESDNDISALPPYQRRYRWVMLAVVWLLYGAFGLVMRSISPVVTPMLRDLNMSYSEMGLILGSWQLIYIPMSIMAGIAMDRWGIRRTLFAGTVIMALSEVARYFVTGFATLLPVVAVLGIGGPLISVGAPKTVAMWFRGRNRATAVGLYTTAPWIGGLFAFAGTNSLMMPLTDYSWRSVFVIYGIVAFIFAVAWLIFARDTGQSGPELHFKIKETFLSFVRVRNIVIVLFGGLVALFMEHGFSNWLPRMLETKGFTPESAGFIASVPLMAAIPAVLIIPRITPAASRSRVLAVLAFFNAAALLVTYFGTSWTLPLILVVYGFTAPCLLPMLMLLLMDDPHVGPERMGLAGGIFFASAEIGGFSGPSLMGVMADVSGHFLPGLAILAFAGLMLVAGTFFITRTAQ